MFNICVLGTPRSRSSFFTYRLENYYNITNYFEYYDTQNFDSFKLSQDVLVAKERDPNKKNDLIHKIFLENQKKVTNKIFSDDKDYVIKFWVRNIITKFDKKEFGVRLGEEGSRYIENLETYNPKILTNLTNDFRLNQYSEYYFLTRNPTDIVASLAYAMETRLFLMTAKNGYSAQELKDIFYKTQEIPHLEIKFDTPRIRFYIFEVALTYFLEKYLIDKNLNYTKLDYYDIPDYIEKHFPIDKSKIVKTKTDVEPLDYNYREIITNYDQLEIFVNEYYKNCIDRINELGIKFI